jgi:hypothetical protein
VNKQAFIFDIGLSQIDGYEPARRFSAPGRQRPSGAVPATASSFAPADHLAPTSRKHAKT